MKIKKKYISIVPELYRAYGYNVRWLLHFLNKAIGLRLIEKVGDTLLRLHPPDNVLYNVYDQCYDLITDNFDYSLNET